MCVAVVVESKEGPSALEMWQMDDSNPHGVGVAWAMGDLVRYKKGLKWKDAYDLLQRIPRPALLHFRWATHGGQARHLTHPFPIGPRALTSRKLNGASKAVLIHNGVWSDYKLFAPEGIKLEKWSDTAVAAYAAGVLGEEILDEVSWSTAVARASGNGRLDITMRGDWFEHEGNLYSNFNWMPYTWHEDSRYSSTRYPACGWEIAEPTEEMTGGDRAKYAFEPVVRDDEWTDYWKHKEMQADRSVSTWLDEYEEAQKAIQELPPVGTTAFDQAIDDLTERLKDKR